MKNVVEILEGKKRKLVVGDYELRLRWQDSRDGGLWFLSLGKAGVFMLATNECNNRRFVIFDLWDVLRDGLLASEMNRFVRHSRTLPNERLQNGGEV